ncbi:DUF3592 domain-containing protein [Arthrobacter sp. zg-Y895]|uniref:DUF3592 domain-containing protein n=1 Tax=Arthrobacter sp. zg-Y895 TaxID=2886933 RepID=UPI001D14908A|nr:DUF3592 domain-containing protein [Arthrobacter sp. zg-Y895]MCC3301087.1 DUF3592 domain-containing protein [Arthrobacter sp. zg-Y895]
MKWKQVSALIPALVLGVALLLLGVAGVGVGFYTAYSDHRLVANGTATVGTVTEVDFGKCGRRHSRCAFPTLTYVDHLGMKHSKVGPKSNYSTKRDGAEETLAESLHGEEFSVFYDPSNPGKAVVEGEESSYLAPLIGLVPGAVGGVITYGITVVMVHIRKKSLATGTAGGRG